MYIYDVYVVYAGIHTVTKYCIVYIFSLEMFFFFNYDINIIVYREF